jgi:protoheme IX farnesyltransferase
MAMGDGAWPDPVAFLHALAGTALVGAGCGALNAWYERERDAWMARTRDRPLPAGRLSPQRALAFGLAISGLGLWTLALAGGWLPTAIGLAALLHYLLVYTVWLKPRSPNAVVVGGVAGAIAPVIADAAVHQSVGLWGLVLFAIVFVWQPPHFWAIALYRKEEYAAAGFPMMPSVVGERGTRRRMLGWAIALIPVTLLPWLGGALGPVYACIALAGGAAFVAAIVSAIRVATRAADRRVFTVSLFYLAALLAAMLVELALRGA